MCRIDMITREQVPSLTTTPLPSPLPFPLPPPSLKKVLAPPPLTSPHLYPSQGCDGTDEEEWHAYRIAHGLPRFNNERIRSLAHLSSRLRLHYGGLRPCASGTRNPPSPSQRESTYGSSKSMPPQPPLLVLLAIDVSFKSTERQVLIDTAVGPLPLITHLLRYSHHFIPSCVAGKSSVWLCPGDTRDRATRERTERD